MIPVTKLLFNDERTLVVMHVMTRSHHQRRKKHDMHGTPRWRQNATNSLRTMARVRVQEINRPP